MQAVGFQIPHDVICRLIIHPKTGIPISEKTLELRFQKELSTGTANTRVLHAMALWKQVQAGHVTAMIWWDKTRNGIGRAFGTRDHGEEQPDKPPPIVENADIVVVARRLAFTLAQGAHRAKKLQPPDRPVKATSTNK